MIKNYLLSLGLYALLLPWTAVVQALDAAEQRGLEIAREADRRDQGWGDSSTSMEMILRSKEGETASRALTVKVKEGQPAVEEGDRSLIVFNSPKDQKGTALLTYSYCTRSDEQWLYLPALKRVKKIASDNKSGPFVGSEFAFEDFSDQEVEKYRYRYLRDEPFNGIDCFVMERYPLDSNSGYSRELVWIDQAHYRIHKVDYYDRKQTLLKTLSVSGYQQYNGKYWRADLSEMVNHQNGRSTSLKAADYRFSQGLSDDEFSQNSLQRAR